MAMDKSHHNGGATAAPSRAASIVGRALDDDVDDYGMLLKAHTVEPGIQNDLSKLKLEHRYKVPELRAKFPWYRNSYENKKPFEDWHDHEMPMDAPVAIPKDLRPAGTKRRYLRTIQLVSAGSDDDSDEDGAAIAAAQLDRSDRTLGRGASGRKSAADQRTFEQTLRRQDSLVGKQAQSTPKQAVPMRIKRSETCMRLPALAEPVAMNNAMSCTDDAHRPIVIARRADQHVNAPLPTHAPAGAALATAAGPASTPTPATRVKGNRRASVQLITRPDDGTAARKQSLPETSGGGRVRARDRTAFTIVTPEELHSLGNSANYFGATAKQRFYDQYKQLYSRPYLYVERSQESDEIEDERDRQFAQPPRSFVQTGDAELDDAPCDVVALYPTSRQLARLDKELIAAKVYPKREASGFSALPVRDALSPRSLFLTTCITQPHLAVPFLVRKRTTKVFDFSYQSLGDAFMCEFAKCLAHDLPFVEEILVRDNRLSDHGLNCLLRAVTDGSSMMNLTKLDISQNEIGPQTSHTLRQYLVSAYCTLQVLVVDNADIDDVECAAFMTAFNKNQSIKKLLMSSNCIGKAENLNVVQPNFETGGEAIATMLLSNAVVQHLDLAWNFLRLESSIALAKSMQHNHTLVELHLAYNSFADSGVMRLGEAMRFNHGLQVLDVSYNSFATRGAMVLANALRFNKTLKLLMLHGNNIGREGGRAIMFALCENETNSGCDVRMQACNIGAVDVPPPVTAAKPHAAPTTDPHVGSVMAVNNGRASNAGRDEINVLEFPVYSAASARVFDPKEPTGRYTLVLSEPYDKMIAMELMRLALFRKGCRFLRIEHKAPTLSSHGVVKKAIHLIRREAHAQLPKGTTANVPVPASASPAAEDGSGGANGVDDVLDNYGLDALFAHIDHDNSGFMDKKEVMTALNRIGLFPRMDNLESLLNTFDYNSSGYLEQKEFSAFLFHAVFRMIDANNSGKIDAEEVEEAFKMLGIREQTEKEIVEAIARYDITGDGEMEEAEFIEFMKDRLLERIKLQLYESSQPVHRTSVVTKNMEPQVAPQVPSAVMIDASTQKPWTMPEDGVLDIDFIYEREAYATNEEAHRHTKISQFGIEQLLRNVLRPGLSKSEQEELFTVAVQDSEIRFTSSQAYQVLEACGELKVESRRIPAVANILPQMLTAKEAQVLVSRTLTMKQRCRLKAEMGSAYSVIMGNPTAHYSLDLAKPKDRIALAKIAEIAQSEKLFSRFKSARGDTSQHGNWENFRNEELDGRRIVLTNAFFHIMPKRGKLCFDYVSTTRPKKGTAPMSDRRFQQLIEELQSSVVIEGKTTNGTPTDTGDASLHTIDDVGTEVDDPEIVDDEIEDDADNEADGNAEATDKSASGDAAASDPEAEEKKARTAAKLSLRTRQAAFWDRTRASVYKRGWKFLLTTASSRFHLSHASKEDVAMKLVQIESAVCDRWLSCDQAAQIIECMPAAYHARPETARILFSRIIDVGKFYQVFDSFSREDQAMCAKTLGWLNIMNPMAPERRYSLDLSVGDERELTKVLVELAIAEPGENWLNQSFTMVKGEPGIPGWKLPVRWEKEDGNEGGVNRSGFLELEYYSGADRGCAPVVSFRKTLMNRVLAGTRLYCL